jgi:hypothetical protein
MYRTARGGRPGCRGPECSGSSGPPVGGRRGRLNLALGTCIGAVVISVAALAFALLLGGEPDSAAARRVEVGTTGFRFQPDAPSVHGIELPSFASKDPEIAALYRFALARPDLLNYIPCTCGCGSSGHLSNWNCYVRQVAADGTVVLDDMAPG